MAGERSKRAAARRALLRERAVSVPRPFGGRANRMVCRDAGELHRAVSEVRGEVSCLLADLQRIAWLRGHGAVTGDRVTLTDCVPVQRAACDAVTVVYDAELRRLVPVA